ncbi:hypothetical protein KSP40_PGU009385 [Platanthera guangdongensis]|uniref:Putative plant transposon protein domain-containing protein n=1 Tax=Platanthera guangdongensis TaxID=2320717 RepID=A0ABR2MDE8_9ASPA
MEKRSWSLSYTQQIQALQWETLCHPRDEAILPWVYEFYSNARFSENESVMVRGKVIDFSANSINKLYELGCEEDFYSLNHPIVNSEVATLVCNSPDLAWSNAATGSLKSTSLSREAKVWLLFINASIMPTRHLNNVTLDRATLTYHILKGNRVNVGEVISTHLKMKIKENKVRQLWFPVLITELCRSVGVVQSMEDLVTHVGREITERVVKINIKVGNESDDGIKKPRKKSMGIPSSSSGKPDEVLIPGAEGATLADILGNIEYMKVYNRCQHRYFRSRLDYLQNSLDNLSRKAKQPIEEAQFEYQWQFDDQGNLVDMDGNSLDPTEMTEDKDDDAQDDDEG